MQPLHCTQIPCDTTEGYSTHPAFLSWKIASALVKRSLVISAAPVLPCCRPGVTFISCLSPHFSPEVWRLFLLVGHSREHVVKVVFFGATSPSPSPTAFVFPVPTGGEIFPAQNFPAQGTRGSSRVGKPQVYFPIRRPTTVRSSQLPPCAGPLRLLRPLGKGLC